MTPPPDASSHVVCNLSIGERPERLLEWSDLHSHALASAPLPDGFSWQFDADMSDAVESLAAREIDCCGSWLDAKTQRLDGRIELKVTTSDAGGLEVIRTFTNPPS